MTRAARPELLPPRQAEGFSHLTASRITHHASRITHHHGVRLTRGLRMSLYPASLSPITPSRIIVTHLHLSGFPNREGETSERSPPLSSHLTRGAGLVFRLSCHRPRSRHRFPPQRHLTVSLPHEQISPPLSRGATSPQLTRAEQTSSPPRLDPNEIVLSLTSRLRRIGTANLAARRPRGHDFSTLVGCA